MFIKKVKPSIIKNSRREKTIKIEIQTYEGKFSSSAPSGKSTGEREVPCYNERGIQHTLKMLKAFSKLLENKNFMIKKIDDLKKLDILIENFEKRFGNLGGNSTYALETSFLKAAARSNKKDLYEFIHEDFNPGKKIKVPMPVGNCIGGGLHSRKIKGKRPDFQEFLLIPNEKTFSRAVTVNLRAYEKARKLLKSRRKNDENAWMTPKSNEEVLEIMKEVSKKYNLRIGLDVAASSFFDKGYYNYKNKELIRDRVDQIDYISGIVKKYGIFYLEDPLDENDFLGFKQLLEQIKENRKKTLVVGDDLTTTNPDVLKKVIRQGAINAMIIKPNQIGSILKVKEVVRLCQKNNIVMIFSHRSGETIDNSLADYAVGFGADFIKTGIYGPERLIKLKRIMDIEKKVNS